MSAEEVDPVLTERVVAYLLEESEKVTEKTTATATAINSSLIRSNKIYTQNAAYSAKSIYLKGVPTELCMLLA